MEFVLSSAINATAEVAAADLYPHIRVFDGPQQNVDSLITPAVPLNVTRNSLLYVRMNWSVASSKTVGPGSDHCCRRRMDEAERRSQRLSLGAAASGFSAICWLAARDFSDILGGKVPVGAIDQSYGGTSIQQWMSESAIKSSNAPVATQCCGQACQNGGASCLYNGQIEPYTLGPTQFTSVLWYQGEQNANCGGPTQTAGAVYSTMLHALVRDWRTQLQQPALPFGSCVLAPWKSTKDNSSFAQMRLAQLNLTAHVESTFDISTLDSGNPAGGAVHSKYKQAVGHRAALGMASFFADITPTKPYKPPAYSSAAASKSGAVTVTLSGLYGQPPRLDGSVSCPPAIGAAQCAGFEVLSSSCVWHTATASLDGSALVLTPASGWSGDAVGSRYGFANWPLALVKVRHKNIRATSEASGRALLKLFLRFPGRFF